MGDRESREQAIEELALSLLYLTRFSDGEGSRFHEIAWKNYDFDAIERLDEKGLIVNPRRRRGGGNKYAYMTEAGRKKARELLSAWGIRVGDIYEKFEFRAIRQEEAGEAAEIERICFPPNEACSEEHITERIQLAPDFFLVAADKENGKLAGFLNGIAVSEQAFRDAFFTDASLHDPDGENVMLLGLDVLPEYRKQGLARELMFAYCRKEQERGRRMLVLTCLENKVKMYQKLGFRDLGESQSTWGGEKWHEMDIVLNLGV